MIGNNCTIRPGVQLENCKVGNNCVVTTGISLKNVEIPSNSTIFQTESGWNRKEVGDNSLFVSSMTFVLFAPSFPIVFFTEGEFP